MLKYMGYTYKNIEMTGMWTNFLKQNQSHPPHTHSNNILSGVFYLLSSNNEDKKSAGAPIQFFDPRVQAHVFSPRNTANHLNSNIMQFPCKERTGYIFPSWLQHWVPPTHIERISVSWNILVRGEYGAPNTLQNAYI